MSRLFPLSEQYSPAWVRENSLGENALHLLESLCAVLPLDPGMRVLDLGCGRCITSIFLANEFGVHVSAIDDSIPVFENKKRIEEAGCASIVTPVKASAITLPEPETLFDAIVAVQSYLYYGTTEGYLPYLLNWLKPNGYVAIVDACTTREIPPDRIAVELDEPGNARLFSKLHSLEWWQTLWLGTGLVEVTTAEYLPEAEFILNEYVQDHLQDQSEQPAVHAVHQDANKLVTLFRMVARKK